MSQKTPGMTFWRVMYDVEIYKVPLIHHAILFGYLSGGVVSYLLNTR